MSTPDPAPTTSPSRRAHSAEGAERDEGARHDRLLPWIAAERSLRAIVLIAIGAILITHPHTNWGKTITDFSRNVGFDPSHNGIQKVIAKIQAISPNRYVVYGGIALAYGLLEGAEGYGLWRRRRWGEYLTVIATSLLFIPEIYEIAKNRRRSRSAALLVNLLVVIYLVVRLRRHGG